MGTTYKDTAGTNPFGTVDPVVTPPLWRIRPDPPKGLLNQTDSTSSTSASPMPPVVPPAVPPTVPTIPPIGAPAYPPAGATATSAVANPYTVSANQTVQDQIKQIVGNDSPLMQQAASIANQKANDRGLLNSSIAVGSAQNAVIGQALPIAQQDAATYNKAMTDTVNAQNAASTTNATLGTNVNLQNADSVNAAFNNTLQSLTTLTNTTLNNQTQTALANLDTQTKLALGTLDAQNRQLLQTNANTANMFQETVKNIAAISVDQTLSQAAKDAAVQTQINLLREGLKTTAAVANTVPADIEGLNLDQFFNNLSLKVTG